MEYAEETTKRAVNAAIADERCSEASNMLDVAQTPIVVLLSNYIDSVMSRSVLSSTESAKMVRAYILNSLVEDEDTFDDGAVLLLHGGVGEYACVEPTFEDLECLAARGGTAAALCNCGVCAKIGS